MPYTGMPAGLYPQPMQPWEHQPAQNNIAMDPQALQNFGGQYYYTRPQGTTQSSFQLLYQRCLHDTNNSTGTTQHRTAHQGQFGSAIPQGQSMPMNSTVRGYGIAHPHYAPSGSSQAPWASQMPANARAAPQQWHMSQPTNPQAGFQQPGRPQATLQQMGPPPAALPQTGFPPAPIPQGISWPSNPQAVVPQPTDHQAGSQQPCRPQATLQQTGPPQAAFTQADCQQEASTEATAPQAIPPQNISQQPYHPEEAYQRPQESSLSFDQRLAAFRRVPEPHPEPVARSGPGRKKKLQRFWAPQDASESLKRRYGRLQTVDQRVNLAIKKLQDSKPSCVDHLQNILIRNMQEREDLWNQCLREEQGLIAIELPLPEAEDLAVKMHKSWMGEIERHSAKLASLKAENPQAIGVNGDLDNRGLGLKDRQGLQTMLNWQANRWHLLYDSYETLKHAWDLVYGVNPDANIAFLMRIHKLEIYKGWSEWAYPGDSQDKIDKRKEFSDPDPTTWGLGYEAPINPAQPEMQEHQFGQLENAQLADDPQFNYEFGTGLDQPASIHEGMAEDGSLLQLHQAPNYEPNQQELQFQQDLNYGGQQDFHLQQPPTHDGHHQELELQQVPNYDGNQDELQEITFEEAEAEIQAYDQMQQQQREDDIQKTIHELQVQRVVLTDEEVAEIFGTTGPNGEYQPPPAQEPSNNEGMGSSGDPGDADAPYEIDPDYQEEQPEQPQVQEASNDGQIQEQVLGNQDVEMEDPSSSSSLEMAGDDDVEKGIEWLDAAWDEWMH